MINPEYFVNAFNDGWSATYPSGKVIFKCRHVGDLIVTTGQIIACDALTLAEPERITPQFPAGKYKVILSIEVDKEGKETVALAKLEIRSQAPVRWEMVQRPKNRFAFCGKDKHHGYPVDSGTGCFLDAAYLQLLSDQIDDPVQFDRIVGGGENADRADHYWTWRNLTLEPASGANVIMFRTGYGDGWYESYYGYDEHSNVAELITEFIGEEERV